MNTEADFWERYQRLRDRIDDLQDRVDLAGWDLEAIAQNLPANSYPQTDWDGLVKDIEKLAEHVREVRASAKAKHVNGIEADRNIDALIGTVQ